MNIPEFKIINGYPMFIGAIINTDEKQYKIATKDEKDRIIEMLDKKEIDYQLEELPKPQQKYFEAIEDLKTFDSKEVEEKLQEVIE